MGNYVIKNGKILYNGYDLSGDHNQIGLTVSREEKECTTFGRAGVQRLAGMQSFDVSGSGFFEAGTGKIDTVIAPTIGTSSAELTIMPQGSSDGSKCFIGEINTFEYAPGGSVGDVMGFTFAGKGEGAVLVDGTLLVSGAKSTSSAGTAFQVGAVSAGRIAYGILHCTETPTAAMNVVIQSAATSGGSYTTRLTFTQVSSLTSEWKATTGNAITDTWWRARWIPTVPPDSATIHVGFGISYL